MVPAVSVVVPTRNRRRLLQQTLRSILAQDGVAVEVIVVDEASGDGTAEFLASLGEDRVTSIRHQSAKGLARARNAGLDVVTTEWVAFVDDDDLWAPGKLMCQLAALRETPLAEWACVGAALVDERLRVFGQQRLEPQADVVSLLQAGNVIPGSASSVLTRTEFVRAVGAFREDLRWGEDWDLWIRMALAAPLAVVDRPLMAYRLWPTSMSHDTNLVSDTVRAMRASYAESVGGERLIADNADFGLYLAKQDLRAGRRLAAAGRYLDVAVRHRRPARLFHAGGALLAPTLLQSVGRWRSRQKVVRDWVVEADAWLTPFRAMPC